MMTVRDGSLTLKTGERLAFYKSDDGTYTVDMKLTDEGPIAVSVTTGNRIDAVRALAERFEMLVIELRALADTMAKPPGVK